MSEPLTPERLAELRRIAEAATPGTWGVKPWRAVVDDMLDHAVAARFPDFWQW